MDIVFEKYAENPDFLRKEIEFTLSFEGAIPSRESIKHEISVCYGVSPELIALDSLKAIKGKKKTNGKARIYPDEKTMKRYEKR